MDRLYSLLFYIFLLTSSGRLSGSTDVGVEERKVYIVYMGSLPNGNYSPTEHHIRILHEVVNSSNSKANLVRSYKRSFNGFSANLTYTEQQKLATHPDVVWVFPSENLKFQTTASWDFMGFPQNVHRNLSLEGDTIVGVIDSGIWPESKSFSDHGFGPIPKKWKGTCDGDGKNFTCNKKIIGARHYGFSHSPRDFNGHGTHTASTAAGNNVPNASFYGIAQGVARGAVPSARIAVYSVCTDFGCAVENVLAGFDDAIADGVDIITISLGSRLPMELKDDAIAIGSFHAATKGILTVQAAGNGGYKNPGSVTSTAPWLFSVGATTINRKIVSKVILQNGKTLMGNAVNSFQLNGTKFPLIYGKDASKLCDEDRARSCESRCLDKELVAGKIVLCDRYNGMVEANNAKAIGSICLKSKAGDVSFVVPVPASSLNSEQFEQVENYIESTKLPEANILISESIPDSTAPVVPSFSSRGPNSIFPDILKPDIVAPGVDILAAFSPEGIPSGYSDIDQRHVDYSVLSGTSMSCPHVAGAAAYVKSLNPSWSPSIIKSALMTTAWQMNSSNTIGGDAEFSYGAGHLDPVKATNPGLVYETLKEDYIKMICGLKYDSSTLRKIFGDNTTCERLVSSKQKDLNYPTMTSQVGQGKPFSVEFPRTVTNVGLPTSTYKARITKPSQINVKVEPSVLSFSALNERQSFNVTVTGGRVENMVSASLEWFDGIHIVRSPIILYSGSKTKN